MCSAFPLRATFWLVLFLLYAIAATVDNASILIPDQPSDVGISTHYEVQIRPLGGSAWNNVPLYTTTVAEINATTGGSKRHATQFGIFDFDGTVEVAVTPNTTIFPEISSVRVRPLSYGVIPNTENGTITFNISQPHNNVVIEVNEDVFDVIHLFTSDIEQNVITEHEAESRDDIIYYGPGYHTPTGAINLTSGTTLYLASGSYLEFSNPSGTSVNITNASNVTIKGRGFLSAGINIQMSNNISVDGAFVSTGGFLIAQSQHVHSRGWRSITSHQWGDGMDVYCSQNVLVEKAFIRSSDDSIALYQHRNNWFGNSSNITVRDSSLWADVAHPINIGTHGNPDDPETMDGITLQNIDILDQREPQIDYEGAIAFSVGDENTIQNALLDDIRVEDFRWGMLFSFRIMYNKKYNTAPGRAIKNVTVRDLVFSPSKSSGHTVNTASISGYAEDRSIDLVDFQGLVIDGLHIWDNMTKPSWYATTDYIPATVGSVVNNLTFSS